MRRQQHSRMQEILQTLLGLKQLGAADTDQLAQLQGISANAEMQPLAVDAAGQQNRLLKEQADTAPAITQAKMKNSNYQAIGDLGQGLGMSAPAIAPQVMQQILESQGLYSPDPNAALNAMAAKLGLHPDQLRALQAKMIANRPQQ